MTDPTPTVDAKATTEYAEGRHAFLDGQVMSPSHDPCPYPMKTAKNNERTRWHVGWYDARCEAFLDRLDAKYGTPIELRERG